MIDKRYIKKENVEKWGDIQFDNEGLLLYEYVRGSHAYGLNVETSDQDRGGIYLASNNTLLGMTARNLMYGYKDIIHSSSNDEVWYEFSRFAELVSECNPNILESLFIDDEFVLYEHPIITELKSNRDLLITKECFAKFGGYAKSQIMKAKGLNKKIVKPVTEKKLPIDFIYTFYNQGSTKIANWLAYRGLHQEFCGLVAIPNMHNTYGVYYDWASHIDNIPNLREVLIRIVKYWEGEAEYQFTNKEIDLIRSFEKTVELTFEDGNICYLIKNMVKDNKKYYKGIIGEDSQDIRLSSVPEKDIYPICHIVYNQEGYAQHARDYTSYKKWEKERNEARYSLNKGHEFDAKNMMHSFRLLNMCCEIAKGEGVLVNRRNIDREFLLNIRNHKYDYEYLMNKLEELDAYRKVLQEKSTINDTVPKRNFNNWIISMRKIYGNF